MQELNKHNLPAQLSSTSTIATTSKPRIIICVDKKQTFPKHRGQIWLMSIHTNNSPGKKEARDSSEEAWQLWNHSLQWLYQLQGTSCFLQQVLIYAHGRSIWQLKKQCLLPTETKKRKQLANKIAFSLHKEYNKIKTHRSTNRDNNSANHRTK